LDQFCSQRTKRVDAQGIANRLSKRLITDLLFSVEWHRCFGLRKSEPFPIEEDSESADAIFRFESDPPVRCLSAAEQVLKGVEMKILRIRMTLGAALLVVAAMLAFGAASALAQDATPAAGAEPAHPVHIHSGTCDSLGDVVYPLHDIETYSATNSFSFGPAATPAAGSMATPLPSVSVTQTTPVQFSLTHVDANIVDLMSGGYAINAHESAENIQNYIACGNIPQCAAAACQAVTSVVIELAPQNNSGYFGVAQIESDPNGGVNVGVFLFHPNMPATS
jgi:hypothetical protein